MFDRMLLPLFLLQLKDFASKASLALLFRDTKASASTGDLSATAASSPFAKRRRERFDDTSLSSLSNDFFRLTVHALAVGLHQLLELRRLLGLELDQGSVLSRVVGSRERDRERAKA